MYVLILDIYNKGNNFSTMGGATIRDLCGKLALNESQSLRTVLVDVLLVSVGIVASAAVGVSGVAVQLDDAGAGRRALEASRAGGKLETLLSTHVLVAAIQGTYPLSPACANVVRKASAVAWVTHEDGGFDGPQSIASECGSSATAESVVHNLTTLLFVSNCINRFQRSTYLRVSNEDDLSARALLVIGCDSSDDSSGSLALRTVVANTTTRCLATACRVNDGFGAGSGVCSLDLVHKTTSRSISIALRDSSLTSPEDVDPGAALPLSELDWVGNGKAEDGEGGSNGELHVD